AAGKKLAVAACDPFGVLAMVREEGRGELAGEKARQRNQAVGAFLEPAPRDDGATAQLIVEPGARQELAKAQVAGARAAEQQQAKRLVALGRILDPTIGADERLH